jgi:hypothetical protein
LAACGDRTAAAGLVFKAGSKLHVPGLVPSGVAARIELQIAPLLTNLQQCAETSDQISRTDEAARELRDQGLHHRAHREDNAALEDRMRLNGYREQVLRTADIILRTTAPLLDRPPQR